MNRANEIMEMLESVFYVEEDYEIDEDDYLDEGDMVGEYTVTKKGKTFLVKAHRKGEKAQVVAVKDHKTKVETGEKVSKEDEDDVLRSGAMLRAKRVSSSPKKPLTRMQKVLLAMRTGKKMKLGPGVE